MPYKIGISSGWWGIAKDPNLLGLYTKAGSFGATAGVQFNQVDLDTILEFLEPDLKQFMDRMVKELGIEIGLHGEVREIVALESAERKYWEQSHDRFVTTIKNASELGFVYVNMHLSVTQQLFYEEARIRPFGFSYQVVDHLGRAFWELAEQSPAVKRHILRLLSRERSGMAGQVSGEEIYRRRRQAYSHQLNAEITAEALRRVRAAGQPETKDVVQGAFDEVVRELSDAGILTEREANFLYGVWKDSTYAKYVVEAGEIDAYILVAIYMIETGDPLWSGIVGPGYSNPDRDAELAYIEKQPEFNAAVAAKYMEGHLTKKDHTANKNLIKGISAKEFLEKNKLMLALEMPQSGEGVEGLARFYNPLHSQYLIRKLNSPMISLCIDFEQTIGQRIDVDKLLGTAKERDAKQEVPGDFGKLVFLIHVGEPVPYFGTAHIPIAIGGRGQDILYRWLYSLKQKGFKDGYILFERGGGRRPGDSSMFNVFEYSVWALRQIVKHLDLDTKPNELPPEFYGLSFDNKDIYARQLVTVRDHAWDPLQDLLAIPEEKHTFLSRAAVDKGKREEWERRKFR